MGNKKLYALCVGINDYQYVPKLNGCVPDATNIYNYLQATCANTDYTFDGIILTDAQATKANMIKNFTEHLSKAGGDDIAVFYFSGHGAEEDADEVFHAASTKPTLNTNVCYDSRGPGGVTDIADKEWRYLISKMTYTEDPNKKLPHFVIIMDSCHSGGATKDADSELVARLTEKGSPRKWDQFIFHDKLSRQDFVNAKSLRDILPEGEHVFFSSCLGNELAYEIRGSGVFTSTLLEVLKRTSGKVSYKDLYSRITYFIKGRFPQTPTVSVVSGDSKAMKNYFLGGASENKGLRVNLTFNSQDRAWLMDMGALQGVPPVDPDQPVTLSVKDANDKEVATGTVVAVMPGISKVNIEGDVDIQETYSAEVKGIYRDPMNVFLEGAGLDALRKEMQTKAAALKETNVELSDEFASASYIIEARNGDYIIRRPAEKRPLVKELPISDKGSIDTLLHFLQVIAKWEFTRSLENTKTLLGATTNGKPPVSINVYKVHDEYDANKDELLTPDEGGRVVVTPDDLLRIGFVNNTRNKKLFISLLGMDMLYGVDASLIVGDVDYVDPGESLWVWEKDVVPLDGAIEDYHVAYNVKEAVWDLKLLVSTTKFEVEELKQDALPAPSADAVGSRAIKRRTTPDSDDWCTELVSVVIKNPNYK
jgi:hypothetical protein